MRRRRLGFFFQSAKGDRSTCRSGRDTINANFHRIAPWEKIFRENLFVLLDRIWKTKTFLMPTKNKSQFCIHLSSDRICIDTISYIHSRQFCLTYLETKDSTRTGRTGLSTGAFRFFVGCTSNVPISNLFNRISKHLEMHRLIVIQSPCWWQVYTGASFSNHWKKIGCIGGRQYDEREKIHTLIEENW